MSMDGHFLIGILTTTAGAMALPLSVFLAFFVVKPEQRPQLSRRAMAAAIFFLALFVLGCVNLYMVCNIGNEDRGQPVREDQTEDSQEPDGQGGQDGSKQEAGGIGHSISPEEDLSPEELLVEQNWDEIQRQKAAYSEADTEKLGSEGGDVSLYVCEKAGCIFQDQMKTGDCRALAGAAVSSAKVLIMDYSTDTMICTLSSEKYGSVRYSPGNQKKFYAIVFHDNYDICVTCPFQVVNEDRNNWADIFLEKKDCQYTPLFQLRLYMPNLDAGGEYSTVPAGYDTRFRPKNIYEDRFGSSYPGSASESGILRWDNRSYFSLSTDYVVEVWLLRESGTDWIESKHETFDGSVTNSNQIDLFFEFDQEDSGT